MTQKFLQIITLLAMICFWSGMASANCTCESKEGCYPCCQNTHKKCAGNCKNINLESARTDCYQKCDHGLNSCNEVCKPCCSCNDGKQACLTCCGDHFENCIAPFKGKVGLNASQGSDKCAEVANKCDKQCKLCK
jgi:hypothetical protein